MSRYLLRFLCATTAAATSVFASAQGIPSIPPGAQPGTVERQLQQYPEPEQRGAEIIIPDVPLEAPAPSNAASIRFVLRRLDVVGNKTFIASGLLGSSNDLVGKEVSLAQIYGVAGGITRKYRDAGYILAAVIVPAQRISDGVVRLEVVEGFLSDVKVEGQGIRPGLIEGAKRRLQSDKPLRARTLESVLLLLNDLPGITAQGVLSPSATVSGGTDLTIKVAQERGSVSAGSSYRGSKLQGPAQLEANLVGNSLLGANDSTALKYLQAASADELRLFGLTHTERLSAGGVDLTLGATQSKGTPDLGESLAAFNLENKTTQFRADLSLPFKRSRSNNVRARLGLTYHDGRTDVIGLPLYRDKISAARLGITFDSVDSLGGVNILDIGFDKGLALFNASKKGSPTASRAGGDPEFSKSTLYLARLQSVGGGVSLLVAATGQKAFANLLSSEEFAIGGEQFGRAFDPSEVVGDSGYAGKLELRYTHSFSASFAWTWYGFGETGKVVRKLALPEESGAPKRETATDYGAGIRFSAGTWLTGYVEAAKPSNRAVAATSDKDVRIFGGIILNYRF